MTPQARQARIKVLRRLVKKYEKLAQSSDISAAEQQYYACCLERTKTQILAL
jgi:hypothetical protein